ncbi:MAG: hypothetical protein IPL26_29815 [Leptospiraceae bacterium]|nr:hypothetical protein [Leptospiraceae bacterium]
MKKFLAKGDDILYSNLEDAVKSPRIEKELKDEKKRLGILTSHLDQMEAACDYYKVAGKKDEVMQDPTWLDRNIRWTSDSELSSDGVGSSRNPLPSVSNPDDYWKKNINAILSALDYYKRALNYSGPEIFAADKIRSVAKAVCRPEEIIIAYTSYLNSSDAYVEEILDKEDEEIVKKNQSFFAPILRLFGLAGPADRKEMYGLSPLMKKSIVWKYIKENHNLPLLMDYIRGVNVLLLDTKLRESSPYEADELYETVLFFLQGTEDPKQQYNERMFRFKRGILLFNMGEFENAKKQFIGAKELIDLKDESAVQQHLSTSHLFQSDLMIAKCHFKQGKFKEALISLSSAQVHIANVEGKLERDLLDDYKNTLRETYKKLGRIKEADEIE